MKKISYLLIILSASVYGQMADDTLVVLPNSVVFFSISKLEFNKVLSEQGEDSGAYEVISDFKYYSIETHEKLKKDAKFHSLISAHRYFKIILNDSLVYFDRIKEKEHIVGVLLNRGDEYKICWGVHTGIGYEDLISEFFTKE